MPICVWCWAAYKKKNYFIIPPTRLFAKFLSNVYFVLDSRATKENNRNQ